VKDAVVPDKSSLTSEILVAYAFAKLSSACTPPSRFSGMEKKAALINCSRNFQLSEAALFLIFVLAVDVSSSWDIDYEHFFEPNTSFSQCIGSSR